MVTLSWWYTSLGLVLLIVGTVGGHFLQYVINPGTACAVAVIVGVLAGSLLVEGWSIRLKLRWRR